jgi:hypothetical protein
MIQWGAFLYVYLATFCTFLGWLLAINVYVSSMLVKFKAFERGQAPYPPMPKLGNQVQ